MTLLKNAYIVLGAVLGIASVYLAPCYRTSSWSKKKSKTNEEKKSTSIYLTGNFQGNQKEDNNEGRKRELEVSSLLVKNQSNEPIIDQSQNKIIDGITLIQNETKELFDNGERSRNPDYSKKSGLLNSEEPMSGANVFEYLARINQTPMKSPSNQILNGEAIEKTVKKTYVKKCEDKNVGVVIQYTQTDEDKQCGKDWNVKFESMTESSAKYEDANNHFISISSEVLAHEKLNSSIYKSFEDRTKYIPCKPPRIRKASNSEVFKRSKLNKNISVISSRKPTAQSTLVETSNRIEVKRSEDIKVLAEESDIHHSTFQSDNFRIESRHKTLGHRLWRRYIYVFGNLFSWKKRASYRSKLLDSPNNTK